MRSPGANGGAGVKGYPAVATFRVEYGDTDGQGRVYYANYLRFLDRGRCAYWERAGLSEDAIRRIEHDTVVAEVHCTYRAPASFYDTVSVHTRVSRVGRSSLRMEFSVVNDTTATLMAEASMVIVRVDLTANRSVPFETDFKARVRAFEGRTLEE